MKKLILTIITTALLIVSCSKDNTEQQVRCSHCVEIREMSFDFENWTNTGVVKPSAFLCSHDGYISWNGGSTLPNGQFYYLRDRVFCYYND